MAADPKDIIRWNSDRAVVPVPVFGELDPLPVGKTRFLMARGGLYLETLTIWGRLCINLWRPRFDLGHFGEVEEIDEWLPFFQQKLNPIIEESMLGPAAEQALQGKEWAGWIMCEDGVCFYQPLEQLATADKVVLNRISGGPATLVGDVHSHGKIPVFFSPTDDKDDASEVKICVVVGGYDEERSQFKMRIRYAINGIFVPDISTLQEEHTLSGTMMLVSV